MRDVSFISFIESGFYIRLHYGIKRNEIFRGINIEVYIAR